MLGVGLWRLLCPYTSDSVFAARVTRLRRTALQALNASTPNKVEHQHDERDDEEEMDQASGDMDEEAEQPEDQ
jgi:hypothetical protein